MAKAIVVLTYKSVDELVLKEASDSWRLNPEKANSCKYLICARNQNDQRKIWAGKEKHREAFLICKIKDITKSSEAYKHYDGYGACPLTVAYGKVMLAEFCYGGVVTPSFPLDPREPRAMYWQMKSKLFPYLQWNVMFKGKDWNVPRHKAIKA